jgi:hypothetical protein
MIIVFAGPHGRLDQEVGASPVYRKKFRQAMLMSWITPFFVVIIFRYILRVPLPKEGAVVNVMSMIYYLFR